MWASYVLRNIGRRQVQALTVAKDAERLKLLKEVAGTSVYEERRKESLKIMEETGMCLNVH